MFLCLYVLVYRFWYNDNDSSKSDAAENNRKFGSFFIALLFLFVSSFFIWIAERAIYESNHPEKNFKVVSELREVSLGGKVIYGKFFVPQFSKRVQEAIIGGVTSKYYPGKPMIVNYFPASGRFDVYDSSPNEKLLYKYQKPVEFFGEVELGNDYYYYAKISPDLAFKNFGLNIIYCSKGGDKLLYKNINRDLDSGLYYSNDLHTKDNFAKIGKDTMFVFHGEIISKEQVFSEIPQAKEYYDRYCGKLK